MTSPDWDRVPFADVVYFQEGPGIRNWQYADEGIPFVNIRCLVDGRLDVAAMSRINFEDAETKYQHFMLDAGDLVVSSSGTIGRVASVRAEDLPVMLNTSVIRMRPRNERILQGYLKQYLQSRDFQDQIEAFAAGSVQVNYGPSHLKQMSILLPPLEEQRRIASILGALDDKIELNRQMNKTLEELARAIFKSWFVDFDPVHAKARGERPTGMDDATAALFPDSFEESALGPIPAGWTVQSLSDSCAVRSGGTPKTSVAEYWEGPIPWFSVVDTPRESDMFVVETAKHISEAGLKTISAEMLPGNATILSARGTVGKLALAGMPMVINQSCYALEPVEGQMGFWLYFVIRSEVHTLKQRTHGSVFDTITRDTLSGIQVSVPPQAVVGAFELSIRHVMKLGLSNLHESATITQTRDLLLPRLLTGNQADDYPA